MNLLFITHHRRFKALWRSGCFARELASRGHRVTILCTADSNRVAFRSHDEGRVTIIEAPDLLFGRLRSGWDPVGVLRRMSFLGDASFDLVHAFETRPATIHPLLAMRRRSRAPLVIDWADWWGRGGLIAEQRPAWYRVLFGGVETWYEERFRTLADATTVISHGLAGRAQSLGVREESIFWVPNGCSAVDPARSGDRDGVRKRFGLPADSFVLAFSALDVLIGVEVVLEALRLVRAKHPRVRLLMTGRRTPGLLRAIADAGVSDSVHHLGRLSNDDYLDALSSADAFVLPFPDRVANRGRWPGRVNEYLALGRPIITQRVGEMARLLARHEVGLAAKDGAAGFAECIEELVRDPQRKLELGRRARELAESELSWPTVVDRLEEAYDFACSAR